MLVCKHCSTLNSLDSTFCKRCGTSLPEEDLELARAQLEEVVAEGETKLSQGKLDEAMAIAESATASNPSMIAAWALKSSIHERRGEVAEALESAEQMVELSPDSELAKIRRNQLRSALMIHAQPVAADRRLAFLAAAAIMVIVISAGALIIRNMGGSEKSTTVASSPAQSGLATGDPMGSVPKAATQEATGTGTTDPTNAEQGAAAGGSQGAGASQSNQQEATPSNDQTAGGIAPAVPNVRADGALPAAEGSNTTTELRPVFPNVRQTPLNPGPRDPDPSVAPPPRPVPTPPSGDPDPVASSGGSAPRAEPDRGTYEITVRAGQKAGGSEVVGGSNSSNSAAGSSKAYAKVGNDQFQVGNFAGAVVSFERAIQSGGDPISLNQRLGLAYQKLGRNADSAEAFRRSIDACDAALRSGRGDRERIQATKESCMAYLKVVQGG